MRRLLPILPFFLLPLAAPAAAAQDAAKPAPPEHAFLWKVEREGLATSWLFGTIHVPDDRVHALHPQVKAALEAADAYYGEIPMEEMKRAQEMMVEAASYRDGRTLKELLPEDLWRRLDARLAGHGLNAALLDRFRPFMVGLTLLQLDMLPLMAAGKKALDERLYQVAKAKGKEVGGVERPEDQVDMLANTLTDEEQVESLREQLDDMDVADARGISDLERLLRAWLTGSERYLLAIAMESWDLSRETDRRLYEALLPKRNLGMAKAAGALMKASPEKSFAFAFGTFHFVGERSVVEYLRKDGFTVTRMTAPTPEQEAAWIAADPWLEREEAEAEAEPVGAGG